MSTLISVILYYLALYPNVQRKVKTEIVDGIGDKGNIHWDSLRQLKYTEAFVKEVLRLNSPAERIERTVTNDCDIEVNGVTIHLERGLLCSLLVSAFHRDPEIFTEPNCFNPDRFLNEDDSTESTSSKQRFQSKNFLAFGLGTRACVG